MAWKTPAGQKKPPPTPKTLKKEKNESSFPGLKTPSQPPAKTHYQELQQNEVMVLQAIYGDDFIELKSGHSAWQVRSWTDLDKWPISSLRRGRNPNLPLTYGSRPPLTMIFA
jgi:hypothetical protein